jgi:hypothetical protein
MMSQRTSIVRPTLWLKGRALREIAELIIRAADSLARIIHESS